jgi:4'-phosphopantetheinyl transferase EntD
MPRKHGAAPEWPPGWTGSLSHSDRYAAAAVARRGDIAGIGIDIEPADPLPGEIRDAVIVQSEFGPFATVEFADRIVFCAKEASYKAVYPLDRRFLEFDGMSVNLDTGTAETSYGRRVSLSIHVDHRIVVLAKLATADVGRSG